MHRPARTFVLPVPLSRMVAPYATVQEPQPDIGTADPHTGYQPARAAQRRDQAPHRRRRHLPQRGRHHPPRRRHPARAERRVGRPARPLHDPGNHRAHRAMIPSSACQPWRTDQPGPCRSSRWPSPATPRHGTRPINADHSCPRPWNPALFTGNHDSVRLAQRGAVGRRYPLHQFIGSAPRGDICYCRFANLGASTSCSMRPQEKGSANDRNSRDVPDASGRAVWVGVVSTSASLPLQLRWTDAERGTAADRAAVRENWPTNESIHESSRQNTLRNFAAALVARGLLRIGGRRWHPPRRVGTSCLPPRNNAASSRPSGGLHSGRDRCIGGQR